MHEYGDLEAIMVELKQADPDFGNANWIDVTVLHVSCFSFYCLVR